MSFCCSLGISAQDIVYGIYSEIDIYSDSISYYDSPGCYDAKIDFASNFFPFVTGMSLSLHIDSVIGGSDSIAIYQENYLTESSIEYPPFEIPIESISSGIVIDFLGIENYPKVHYRVVAYGTPTIQNEAYFCSSGKSVSFTSDGCSVIIHEIHGGFGSMDTVKDCNVLTRAGIEEYNSRPIRIYPNPARNTITINSNHEETPIEIELFDSLGRQVLYERENTFFNSLDLSNLKPGLYVIIINYYLFEHRENIIIVN